jgi:peptidoglycan/LPS O-acetylase OafA/YrhL
MLGVGIAILLPFITNSSPQSNILVRIERLGISLAAFSYTLYLTHYPFLWATNKFWPRVSNVDESSILRFLLVIVLSILGAWLFYFPFEAQTSKVRKWLLIKFS